MTAETRIGTEATHPVNGRNMPVRGTTYRELRFLPRELAANIPSEELAGGSVYKPDELKRKQYINQMNG